MPPRADVAEERPRLLVVGDAVAPTGFATVVHNIFDRLQDEYEIHHLGTNYCGDPHAYDWKIYPAHVGGDRRGVKRLKPLVNSLRPRLVFLLNDPWVQSDYMNELRSFQPDLKVVMYCPVDMGPLDPRLVEGMEGVDRFVAYTRFGKAQIEQAAAAVRLRRPAFAFPPVEVIPHGLDTVVFHPLERDPRAARRRAIRTLLGGDPRAAAAFIVLNANRNQPRKRIDVTIKGFSLFAENKPGNVMLYLHMGIEDKGWHILRLAERCGVADRLLLSTPALHLPGIPLDQLNITYNAAAVGLNTSLGEGWGLVSFEHAATGAAQVVPRHSACAELWEGSALLLEPVTTLTERHILTEGHLVSPEGVAEALERLYEDPALLAGLSQAAFENATKPDYRWAAIARRWDGIFKELLGIPRRRNGRPRPRPERHLANPTRPLQEAAHVQR
jgi:D-inositol-3-phosphate glycosyltransferase